MENTEKSILLQEENNHANKNLGITQSSGLGRQATFSQASRSQGEMARMVSNPYRGEAAAKAAWSMDLSQGLIRLVPTGS